MIINGMLLQEYPLLDELLYQVIFLPKDSQAPE